MNIKVLSWCNWLPPEPGPLPDGVILVGNYHWRIVQYGAIFTNGYIPIPNQDIYGITVGGCGTCLVWLKRNGPGDPWQNMGGYFNGTFESGFFTNTIPFDSFSEFTIGSVDSLTSSVTGETEPKTFTLAQNYPNPFNPSTTIRFHFPYFTLVNLKIYDVLEEEVANLMTEEKPAGNYEVKFSGDTLASGLYFYQIKAGNFMKIKKMLLLR